MTIIEQLEDADKTLAADGYKEYSYVRIAISEAIRALRQPPVMPRFLPQPSEVEKLMKEKLEARKINDEFGWTGEWRMSAKDILDVIIDLQNEAITVTYKWRCRF